MSLFGSDVRQHDESVWERILPKCSTNTIFITPWWQATWWKTFGDGRIPKVQTVSLDEDVIGIIPLLPSENATTFIGDSSVFDYMDFPVVADRELDFFELCWPYIESMHWSNLRLESIPESSPTLTHLVEIARNNGHEVLVTESDKTPYAELPEQWEEYLLSLRKKDRHELRRKIRRLDAGVKYRQYEPNNKVEMMDEFFRLMKLSSDEKSRFLINENKIFFTNIAAELTRRDQFKLFFLEIDGINVAACICFDYGGKFLLYNSGYDPEYSSLSIGLINKAFTINTAIEQGKSEYNFLKGTERYKYHLGATDRSVFDIQVSR